MRTLAVFPGRFHPFSLGHQGVYQHLTDTAGIDNVFVATSEKQDRDKSPFSFADKTTMITKTGVPPGRIIKVKSPYNIREYQQTLALDPEHDRLIIALGSDDASRLKFSDQGPFHVLPDGPIDAKKMKPVGDGQHAYVKVIPQIAYNILGKRITHASDIRKMYVAGNENQRNQIIADLYGETDPDLRAIFDQRLGVDQPAEGIIYGQERIYAGEQEASIMREERLACLRDSIQFLQDKIQQLRDGQDYIDEKWTRKYKKSINCANPRGFSQKAHCAARRKRARGGATKSRPVK